MEAKEILEKMRKEDRLLKESKVMKAVQKAMIEMGYEPLGDEVQKIFATIENVSQICTVEQFETLKEKNEPKKVDEDYKPMAGVTFAAEVATQ